MSTVSQIKLPNNNVYNLSVPFIVGTGSTAGTWLGTLDSLTAYYDGLMILYKPSVAGASTTTLNLNSLGAKTVYLNNTSKLTTHYPKNQPILLVYSASQNSGCWMAIDNYDSNTNTNVTQTNTTTDADYRVLFSGTADDTNRTEGARKSGGLLYNPSTSTLKTSSENPGTFAASEFDIIYQDTGGTAHQNEVISANNNGSLNLSEALNAAIGKAIYPRNSVIELKWGTDPNTLFPGTTWVLVGYSDPLNLFRQQPVTFDYGSFNISDGSDSNSSTDLGNRVRTENFMFLIAGTYTITTTFATYTDTNYRIQHVLYAYDHTRTIDNNNSQKSWQNGPFTFTLSDDRYVRFGFRYANNTSIAIRSIGYPKLVLGSSIPDIMGNGSITQSHMMWRRTA